MTVWICPGFVRGQGTWFDRIVSSSLGQSSQHSQGPSGRSRKSGWPRPRRMRSRHSRSKPWRVKAASVQRIAIDRASALHIAADAAYCAHHILDHVGASQLLRNPSRVTVRISSTRSSWRPPAPLEFEDEPGKDLPTSEVGPDLSSGRVGSSCYRCHSLRSGAGSTSRRMSARRQRTGRARRHHRRSR
jgi:hypothetical protein